MTITDFIEKDLSARILHGNGLPPRWSLPSLAQHYRVSLTPVRIAVQALTERGLLLKEGNGRLKVNSARLGSDPSIELPTMPPPPNRHEVLAEHVLRVSLRGEAVFLREEAIAERFAIGRTIVRQTFGRLAGSGLLEHVPRRGWRVNPFREEDLRSWIDIRETLEVKALRLSWPALDKNDIRSMHDANLPNPDSMQERLDNRLHQYFITRSGNRYLIDFFRTQGGYFTLLLDYAALGAAVVAEMAAQHRTILGHILADRPAAAEEALAEHIRVQLPIVRTLLERLRADETNPPTDMVDMS